MSFSVTILGNNSAKPTANRHPSAQIVQIENHVLLVDCGEGTQMQMLRHSIKWGKIDHIFISHLHGDHFLGLVPLLDTYNLSGRTRPLHIYCPAGIQTLVECHKAVTGG
ncbi:MAG: MBL fold metallo-hydrolase, partial [Chitinophagales bacterium]